MISPDASLFVVDLQEKLVPALQDSDSLLRNVGALMAAAELMSVAITVTEHCADRIGATVEPVLRLAPANSVVHKASFSALAEPEIAERVDALGGEQVIMTGAETHVCVLQTALDLLDRGRQVFLVADATATRHALDKEVALARLRGAGAGIVTAEMVMFEWAQRGDTELFRRLLPLIRDR